MFPEQPAETSEVPQAKIVGDRVVVECGGRRTDLRLPDKQTLSESIGQAFDESEIPPPENRPLYLALDWSEFMAHSTRRRWLIGELQSALDSVPAHWLVHQGVCLHNGRRSAHWPLSDLRADRWPGSLPSPHPRDTLGALASAIRAAEAEPGSVRLVFLTWNAGLTVDTGRSSAISAHGALARSVRLRIVQVHGEHVGLFEEIAGRENYDILEYVPEVADRHATHSVRLFDRYD